MTDPVLAAIKKNKPTGPIFMGAMDKPTSYDVEVWFWINPQHIERIAVSALEYHSSEFVYGETESKKLERLARNKLNESIDYSI